MAGQGSPPSVHPSSRFFRWAPHGVRRETQACTCRNMGSSRALSDDDAIAHRKAQCAVPPHARNLRTRRRMRFSDAKGCGEAEAKGGTTRFRDPLTIKPEAFRRNSVRDT